jgi:hypothetical protein
LKQKGYDTYHCEYEGRGVVVLHAKRGSMRILSVKQNLKSNGLLLPLL